jgi:metal-responsive CopG/Arc/MetJ family transcriptional regulator
MTLEQLLATMNEKVKKKVDSEVFQAYRSLIQKYLKEGKDTKRLKQRLGEITLISIPRGERQNK